MKRLVTYSSLADIGFIALGTFSLSTQGLSGAVLLMLNHGIIVAALFILIGFIYQRRGTWQTSELRGLQKAAPVLAGRVHRRHAGLHRRARAERLRQRVPGPLGHVHHPPLVGGGGHAGRDRGRHLPALGLPAGLPRRAREADEKTRDLVLLERLVMAPLIILIVFLGVYPKPVLDRINPSVNQLIAHVEARPATPSRPLRSGAWRDE